ncbi:MAG: ATP-dependent Clp protease ATP-binding subunit, partial [Clostridia bacterium]|nr:ATP-dependent Clp protease ATP-binding subunit [Clostridia bacterium]
MNHYKHTSDVSKVLNKANEFALRLNSILATEHILAGLIAIEGTYAHEILSRYKVDKEAVYRVVSANPSKRLNEVLVKDQVNRVLSYAETSANRYGYELFDTHHLLLGLVCDKSMASAKILAEYKITQNDIQPIIETMTANGIGNNEKIDDDPLGIKSFIDGLLGGNAEVGVKIVSSNEDFASLFKNLNQPPKPRAQKKSENKKEEGISEELKAFGVDMTENARQGKYDPVIGREKEIEQVLRVLSRRTKNNPLIIGEPGVGKTAIVEGLAQAIVDGKVPNIIKDKRIFALDVGSLVAGTKFRGEFEARFKAMLKELEDDKTILFIDEMHMIMSVGDNDGGATIANLLKPLLARGDIPTIGATTIDEYRKHIEKDAALERRFKPIMVDPPSVEDTILILKGIREKYQAHHKVQITDEALVAAATLTDRYVADRYLPDKAIDAIDEAASKMRVNAMVTPPEIVELENKRAMLNESILQAT